jgi:hypothetical protein
MAKENLLVHMCHRWYGRDTRTLLGSVSLAKTVARTVIVSQHGIVILAEIDTILTPFSLSPTTDTMVDCLPTLFLAYCTLRDSDDAILTNDRVVPRPLASDPVPLLTD